MSSSKPFVTLFFSALALLLAACTVTPLEGTGNVSARGGSLDGVVFAAPNTRLDQKLRNELIELAGREVSATTGAGLEFSANVSKQVFNTAVRRGTGVSTVGKVQLTAVWRITDLATGTLIDSGQTSATSSFDQFRQEFANLESERDAETRAAGALAVRLRPVIIRAKSRTPQPSVISAPAKS